MKVFKVSDKFVNHHWILLLSQVILVGFACFLFFKLQAITNTSLWWLLLAFPVIAYPCFIIYRARSSYIEVDESVLVVHSALKPPFTFDFNQIHACEIHYESSKVLLLDENDKPLFKSVLLENFAEFVEILASKVETINSEDVVESAHNTKKSLKNLRFFSYAFVFITLSMCVLMASDVNDYYERKNPFNASAVVKQGVVERSYHTNLGLEVVIKGDYNRYVFVKGFRLTKQLKQKLKTRLTGKSISFEHLEQPQSYQKTKRYYSIVSLTIGDEVFFNHSDVLTLIDYSLHHRLLTLLSLVIFFISVGAPTFLHVRHTLAIIEQLLKFTHFNELQLSQKVQKSSLAQKTRHLMAFASIFAFVFGSLYIVKSGSNVPAEEYTFAFKGNFVELHEYQDYYAIEFQISNFDGELERKTGFFYKSSAPRFLPLAKPLSQGDDVVALMEFTSTGMYKILAMQEKQIIAYSHELLKLHEKTETAFYKMLWCVFIGFSLLFPALYYWLANIKLLRQKAPSNKSVFLDVLTGVVAAMAYVWFIGYLIYAAVDYQDDYVEVPQPSRLHSVVGHYQTYIFDKQTNVHQILINLADARNNREEGHWYTVKQQIDYDFYNYLSGQKVHLTVDDSDNLWAASTMDLPYWYNKYENYLLFAISHREAFVKSLGQSFSIASSGLTGILALLCLNLFQMKRFKSRIEE